MLKIKTFVTSTTQDLDNLVNSFIEENAAEIQDIKFSTDGPRIGAMILFTPKVKKSRRISVD